MKKIAVLIISLFIAAGFCGCGPYVKNDVNVYVLTGPTGVGAVNMWNDSEEEKGLENYHFTAVQTPDQVIASISNGDAQIAAIPTNLAAKLFNKTEGNVVILAVNTLGVLYALDYSETPADSFAALSGRKIVTTGYHSNPEYIIKYLLRENGIDPDKDVELEFRTEGSELLTVRDTDPDAVIIAPQPVATNLQIKYGEPGFIADLTAEWNEVSEDSALMMGCVVATKSFIKEHPEAVKNFLKDYEASIDAAVNDPAGTGVLCEKYSIVPRAAVAEKAIPYCGLCFITGEDMKTKLTGYLQVLFDADPDSIGKMPGDGFWYAE